MQEGVFLHENLWNRVSRGLSFVEEMPERHGVRETNSELCRSQLAVCLPKKGSCFKSKSECVIEELSTCCCNEDGQAKSRVINFVIVFRGLKRD